MPAEIAGGDARIVHQGCSRAGMDDLAGLQHVAEVGGLERRPCVLLDQQDLHAKLAQRGDDAEDLADDERRQPQARLVEH